MFPHKTFSKGWVAEKPFGVGSLTAALRFSKGWVRKDLNLVMGVGCTYNAYYKAHVYKTATDCYRHNTTRDSRVQDGYLCSSQQMAIRQENERKSLIKGNPF